jgi:hypothetical protein
MKLFIGPKSEPTFELLDVEQVTRSEGLIENPEVGNVNAPSETTSPEPKKNGLEDDETEDE